VNADQQTPLRVLVTAPFPAIRAGLTALIETDVCLRVVAECASPSEWGSHISDMDVIVLAPVGATFQDWVVPRAPQQPAVPILLLVSQALNKVPDFNNQPWGILPVSASSPQIQASLHALVNGLWVADPKLTPGPPVTALSPSVLPESSYEALTRRELDVLQCLANGYSNKETARELGIGLQTVKYHISSIFSKLGVNSRTEAIRLGVHQGWVNL
jgi:two-component system, NarL family, response regulator YdfI